MAGGQERILRGRIRSVQSTKKITKAMELIAGSRIVRAQARVAAARPYSEQISEVIRNLAAGGAGLDHPLLKPRDEVRGVAYVAISGDRGLAGGYSSGVIRHVERAMAADRAAGRDVQLHVVGRKAEGYFRFRGISAESSFTGFIDQPTYDDARKIAAAVSEAFDTGAVDQVELVYNQFLSAGSQRLVQRTLMPLEAPAVQEAAEQASHDGPSAAYEFEPSPDLILAELLPRYAEARLFAALLDASASFFAFQQRAMKSASDNADELIKTLSRIMNRARQDAITTEIMEIVGGAEALRQSQSGGEDTIVDQTFPEDLFPAISTQRGSHA
jgi:F-type H+-transporting ATPase subunit gamma